MRRVKQEENIKEKIIREYPGIEGFLEDPKKLKILIKKNGEMENKIPEIKNPFASINLKAVGMKHAKFTANLNDYCEEMYKSTNKKDIKNSNEIETEKFEKKKSKKIEKEAREFLKNLKDKWIKESKKNFKLKNKKKVITTKFGKNLKINKKLNLKQLTRNVSKGIENIMRKFSKRSKTTEYKLLKNEI
uniref:Uncharacterized protein n=1 Tax=Meloidogyne enterolobii TaxID=390850 RepID=A0A6V7XJH6_MELEN|nr:unnamed protein product [Meloidogyne enterolobii]